MQVEYQALCTGKTVFVSVEAVGLMLNFSQREQGNWMKMAWVCLWDKRKFSDFFGRSSLVLHIESPENIFLWKRTTISNLFPLIQKISCQVTLIFLVFFPFFFLFLLFPLVFFFPISPGWKHKISLKKFLTKSDTWLLHTYPWRTHWFLQWSMKAWSRSQL